MDRLVATFDAPIRWRVTMRAERSACERCGEITLVCWPEYDTPDGTDMRAPLCDLCTARHPEEWDSADPSYPSLPIGAPEIRRIYAAARDALQRTAWEAFERARGARDDR